MALYVQCWVCPWAWSHVEPIGHWLLSHEHLLLERATLQADWSLGPLECSPGSLTTRGSSWKCYESQLSDPQYTCNMNEKKTTCGNSTIRDIINLKRFSTIWRYVREKMEIYWNRKILLKGNIFSCAEHNQATPTQKKQQKTNKQTVKLQLKTWTESLKSLALSTKFTWSRDISSKKNVQALNFP